MSHLFEQFEVNREPRWIVLAKLTGASLILHLVLLWMVIYVPAFRDTLNIAALIANTKFVDKDYEATRIGGDVQLVQLTDKFRYPDGYFTPEGQVAAELPASAPAADPFAPKIISQASQMKDTPEPSPSPSPEASPTASPSASGSPSEAIAQASPSPSASPLTQEEAQKELEKTADQNEVPLPEETQINKKALRDFAAYANEQKNQGKLDLNKPFEVVIEAEFDENGKLKNPRFIKKLGDEALVDLFGRMIAALNDSGFLAYLKPISKENPGSTITITVKQGENEVLASVASEASTPERAQTLAKVLNNMLAFGAVTRSGKDEEVIMRNTNATPDGKKVVVNFSMPRQSVVDMIKKQLEPGA